MNRGSCDEPHQDMFAAYQRQLKREKLARKEAERQLEEKSRQLYVANHELKKTIAELDLRIDERTRLYRVAVEQAEKKSRQLLVASERTSVVLEATKTGIWGIDPATRKIYSSRRLADMLGMPRREVIDRLQDASIVVPGSRPRFRQLFENRTRQSSLVEFESEVVMGDQSTRWFRLLTKTEYDSDRQLSNLVGAFVDIHENHEKTKLIHYMATHDSLTKVPNRATFNKCLDEAIQNAESSGSLFALVIIDLNEFKFINDEYGHQAGDYLLGNVAGKISRSLRHGDTVARIGGDEFAIIIRDVRDISVVQQMCDSIELRCRDIFTYRDEEINATVSIGAALYRSGKDTAEDLFRNADLAMYEAKKSTGRSVCYFSDDLLASFRRERRMRQELRDAIANREFRLLYQPQYCIATGKLEGVEALLRWEKPEGCLIEPENFIDVAEQSGLIDEIGKWAIRESCRQASAWRQEGMPLQIAINLSGLQLDDHDLPQLISSFLARFGIPGSSISIEVTESCIIEDVERIARLLTEFRTMGIDISIDDFGTGYSSLSYLHRLPIQTIKIDRSFVAEVTSNDDSRLIVDAIISLSKSLGKKIIAEGVETAAQLEYLRNKQCDVAQGFYFAPPLPAEAIRELAGN